MSQEELPAAQRPSIRLLAGKFLDKVRLLRMLKRLIPLCNIGLSQT
jgi:hypothetical protein